MLRYINVEFTITATCTPCEYLTSRGKTKWCQLKKASTELMDTQNIVWKIAELDMRHVSNSRPSLFVNDINNRLLFDTQAGYLISNSNVSHIQFTHSFRFRSKHIVLVLQPDSLRVRGSLRLHVHVHIILLLRYDRRVRIHFRGTLNKSFMNKRLNSHGWVQEKSRLSNP